MKSFKRIFSIILLLLIPIVSMTWFSRHESTGYASIELIAYPLLFGGISIVVIYLLKRFLLKESLQDFNDDHGTWYTDAHVSIPLSAFF